MCEVSNLQTSPNSKKHPYFWGTFGELKLKKALQIPVTPFSAESEGFEPPDPLRSTVFKTAAFDHSANSPICSLSKGIAKVRIKFRLANFFATNCKKCVKNL